MRPGPSRENLDDADLVALCRDGDEDAWAVLVERFSRYVYAITVRGFRLSGHDAEDVFQEVFARIYEKLDTLRDDTSIRPFITQLTRRLAIDRKRAAARVEFQADVGTAPAVDENVFAQLDEAMRVHDALAALPENCQEILDRFFARDQSYRMISEELEIPSGTIASRISRCLAKLKDELRDYALRVHGGAADARPSGSREPGRASRRGEPRDATSRGPELH